MILPFCKCVMCSANRRAVAEFNVYALTKAINEIQGQVKITKTNCNLIGLRPQRYRVDTDGDTIVRGYN